MQNLSSFSIIFVGIALISCAQNPAVNTVEPQKLIKTVKNAPSYSSQGGMVIGSVSVLNMTFTDSATVVLEQANIADRSGPANKYTLSLLSDKKANRAVFAGSLPAGAYALTEAVIHKTRFELTSPAAPFQVVAGNVIDAGHFRLEQMRTGGMNSITLE